MSKMNRKSNNKRELVEVDLSLRSGKRRKLNRQFVQASPITIPAAAGVIVRRTNVPRFLSSPTGTIVCNTELYATVNGAIGGIFNLSRGFLIPGFMPWVSGVSINYSKWRWRRLRLIYIPTSSTATSGQIVLALGFDQTDTTPGGVAATQAAFRSETTPPWGGVGGIGALNDDSFTAKPPQSVILDLDTSRLTLPWYPYTNSTNFLALSPSDRNSFSPAYVDIAQLGLTTTGAVGSIFAKYEVELIEPISATINS